MATTSADRLAKAISGISSPFIVLALFGILCITSVEHNPRQLVTRLALFFLTVIGLPLIYILIGLVTGKITDIHVGLREQRPGPFIAATIGSLILLESFIALNVPRPLIAAATDLVVCGVIFGVITLYWKISIHAAAFAGSIIMLALVTDQNYVFLLLLFLPAIIWARLHRKKHDPWQAIIATIVVSICGYLSFIFVTDIWK